MSRLQDMYGKDFHPIMKLAENAHKLDSMCQQAKQLLLITTIYIERDITFLLVFFVFFLFNDYNQLRAKYIYIKVAYYEYTRTGKEQSIYP